MSFYSKISKIFKFIAHIIPQITKFPQRTYDCKRLQKKIKKDEEKRNGSDSMNTLKNITFHRETRTQDSQREPKREEGNRERSEKVATA